MKKILPWLLVAVVPPPALAFMCITMHVAFSVVERANVSFDAWMKTREPRVKPGCPPTTTDLPLVYTPSDHAMHFERQADEDEVARKVCTHCVVCGGMRAKDGSGTEHMRGCRVDLALSAAGFVTPEARSRRRQEIGVETVRACTKFRPDGHAPCTRDHGHEGPCAHPLNAVQPAPKSLKRIDRAPMNVLAKADALARRAARLGVIPVFDADLRSPSYGMLVGVRRK